MKKLILIAAAMMAGACLAAIDYIAIPTGETVRAPAAAKVLSARVISTVASGTATAKSIRSIEVMGVSTNVTAATNFTYTVISTNYTAGALVTTTNTLPFNPLPFGSDNWIAFTTNTVVTLSTNFTMTTAARVVATNALTATATCTNGAGTAAAASDPYLLPGEPVFIEGTAKGTVWLFIER